MNDVLTLMDASEATDDQSAERITLDGRLPVQRPILRSASIGTVLEAVRVHGPISRAGLVRRTKFKPPTLTGVISRLLDEGLVVEGEESKSGKKGGRPSRMLRLNAGARQIIAADLEPDHLRAAITDLSCSVLNYRDMNVNRFQDPETTIRSLIALIREMNPNLNTIAGLGVSCPGLIDEAAGVLVGSTNLPKWHDFPIRQVLEKEFKLPVYIGRSVHMAALSEEWSAKSFSTQDTLVVTLRTGIGCAFIHKGGVYRSSHACDGEIGHTVIDIDGLPCECGRRGCLETFISPASITRRVRKLIEAGRGSRFEPYLESPASEIDPELIYRWAREGHQESRELVADIGKYVAIGIANLANLYGPDEIVLCGAIEKADPEFLEELRVMVCAQTLPIISGHLKIRLSKHAQRSALIGAAARVTRAFLNRSLEKNASSFVPLC